MAKGNWEVGRMEIRVIMVGPLVMYREAVPGVVAATVVWGDNTIPTLLWHPPMGITGIRMSWEVVVPAAIVRNMVAMAEDY